MTKKLLSAAILCMLAATIGLAQGTLPPAPTDLVATQTPDAVPVAKLTWTPPTGSYGFAVYRSVDDTSHFQKIALVNSPVYFDHSVKVGYTFFYYVTTVALINSSMRPVESPQQYRQNFVCDTRQTDWHHRRYGDRRYHGQTNTGDPHPCSTGCVLPS